MILRIFFQVLPNILSNALIVAERKPDNQPDPNAAATSFQRLSKWRPMRFRRFLKLSSQLAL